MQRRQLEVSAGQAARLDGSRVGTECGGGFDRIQMNDGQMHVRRSDQARQDSVMPLSTGRP
ncbi:hypothetical protein D3C83_94760 [compost metagenome]